jgi:hypothetical protein
VGESVSLFREPDAGNLLVRFDEREQETGPSQTGLRWRGESQVECPPGDYISFGPSRQSRSMCVLIGNINSATTYNRTLQSTFVVLGVCRHVGLCSLFPVVSQEEISMRTLSKSLHHPTCLHTLQNPFNIN